MTKPSDNAILFEAVKTSIRQDRHGYNLVLAIHPSDIPETLLRCYVGARFQVAMVQVDDHEQPIAPLDNDAQSAKLSTPKIIGDAKSDVALAGELCRTEAFQKWIGGRTEEESARHLRQWLGVISRTEIGWDDEIRRRFHEIVSQYRDDTGLSHSAFPDEP